MDVLATCSLQIDREIAQTFKVTPRSSNKARKLRRTFAKIFNSRIEIATTCGLPGFPFGTLSAC
jgi:hypothetical protein